MNKKMKYKIGVMGKAGRSKDLPKILIKNARIIGKEIAKQGCILITGACMGVSDIVSKSASREGGLVLGYSPSKNLKEHIEPPISYPSPTKNMELIFTGYGKIGRNVLSIIGCDGIIFIGGGIGTLNEFSIAYHEGKVIGILEGVEGVTDKVFGMQKDFKDSGTIIIKDKNPKRLVKRIIEAIKYREEFPRKEIPVTFKNERGKNLSGIFHLPQKEKPPVVIICHGFQNTKSERKYVKLARILRKEGILVFRFDFECCGDSEGDPREITIEREISDLNSALKTILKEGDVDSRRIAFVAGSLGSLVVSLFVERFKITTKTLVFWSQAFDQKSLFKIWYSKEDLKEFKKKEYLIKGEKEIGKDYYLENKNKDYSFIISKLNLPILLIHGKKDKDVPLKFSQKLSKRYKRITLKILSQANHKFDDFSSQQKLIKLSVNWLKKYL